MIRYVIDTNVLPGKVVWAVETGGLVGSFPLVPVVGGCGQWSWLCERTAGRCCSALVTVEDPPCQPNSREP